MKNTHELFNKPIKLSLKSDNFILLEYVEKHPLILSNIGMGSRIQKWIYLTRLAVHILETKFDYKAGKD